MIEFTKGDMFAGNHEALVNPVNCVGKMGKGLALIFKKQFPEMFKSYKRYCDRGALQPGKLHHYREKDIWVVNFPTKEHYRNESKLEYIVNGLKALVEFINEREIKNIGIPALGCGLGGLLWYQVRAEIKKGLAEFADSESIKITVYEP